MLDLPVRWKVYYRRTRGREHGGGPDNSGGVMGSEPYSIGQLAAELGLNTKTLRYDEGLGLLAPAARTAAGYRRYTDIERDTLRFVIKAKAVGLTLMEIGDILALRRAGQEPCAHVRALLARKLAAVEEQLHALSAFRDELLALRDAAAADVCGVIERYTPWQWADAAPAV
jgi:MerR family Zn(II)-responsive transcriptional regulator of zntA